MKMLRSFLRVVGHVVRAPFIGLIWIYQHTLSPDHGPLRALFPEGYCKFTPSCSEYTRQALKKHGLVAGGALGIWRITRCNPCSRGGIDNP